MVDLVCVEPLLAAGFDLLSEETGIQRADGDGRRRGIVVVDPLDGSTNASLGLPWFATSLCWVVDGVPVASMVTNLATGERFEAIAGRGAWSCGRPLSVRTGRVGRSATRSSASVGSRHITSVGGSSGRWARRRSTSARSPAEASTDSSTRAPTRTACGTTPARCWCCIEAGGVIVDALGRDLLTLEHEARRTPIAAANPDLLATLVRSI